MKDISGELLKLKLLGHDDIGKEGDETLVNLEECVDLPIYSKIDGDIMSPKNGTHELDKKKKGKDVKKKSKETVSCEESLITSEYDRKLIVKDLSPDAKHTDIREYFSQFGKVDEIYSKTDQTSGRSRVSTFIVFKKVSGLNAALSPKVHVMKGKNVTCEKVGKIFVSKLPSDGVTDEDLRKYFSSFGKVIDSAIPIKNRKPMNFGFVTFEREEVAKQMVRKAQATINGHNIHIKKFSPNNKSRDSHGRYELCCRGGYEQNLRGHGGSRGYVIVGRYPIFQDL